MAKLLDHEIDGIQEYDNPPPTWLMYLLYASIIFGIGYAIYYPSLWFWPGLANWSSFQQYEEQVAREEAYYAEHAPPKATVELQPENAELVAAGQAVFKGKCAACHGLDGEGKIGPSLTDSTWIYDGSDAGIWESVTQGRPKGMPAWGNVLSPEEMLGVTSYVKKISATTGGGE